MYARFPAAVSRRSGAACILSSLALSLAAGAEIARFPSRADRVLLSATAVDSHGRPVQDLRREEVQVFENGRLQRIEHFAYARESHARVLLLVDASGSMQGDLKTTSTRMAATQILAALGPQDEIALAGFDHEYWGVVPFTTDHERILNAFGELKPFGSTALHDALGRAASDLASHGEGRRAILVVTDGIDTASLHTPDEVLAQSRALDVPIYAVSVVSPLDDPASAYFTGHENAPAAVAGEAVLARYAQLSGGSAFVVSDFVALKKAAEQIVGELTHQYRLGYDPPPGPVGFRRIEVRTTRKGIRVRARSGYLRQS